MRSLSVRILKWHKAPGDYGLVPGFHPHGQGDRMRLFRVTPLPLYGWCASGSTRLLSRYLVTNDPQQPPPACLEYIPQAQGKSCELRRLYAVSDDSLDVGRRSYWVPVDPFECIVWDEHGPLCFRRRGEAAAIGARVMRVVVGDSP